MSSKASKMKKIVKRQIDPLYNSLFGSIIMTVGITTGKTVAECRKLFNELKKNPKVLPETIAETVDYIWTIFGNDDLKRVRAFYVLITDKLGVRSPMVSFVDEEETLGGSRLFYAVSADLKNGIVTPIHMWRMSSGEMTIDADGTISLNFTTYNGTSVTATAVYDFSPAAAGVEDTHWQSPMTHSRKVLRNGQLLIEKEGQWYSVLGERR